MESFLWKKLDLVAHFHVIDTMKKGNPSILSRLLPSSSRYRVKALFSLPSANRGNIDSPTHGASSSHGKSLCRFASHLEFCYGLERGIGVRPVPQDLLSSANFDHWFPTFIGDLLMWIFDFQWILSDFLTFLTMLRSYLTASSWLPLVALFWKRGWCSFEICLVSSFQTWGVTVSPWSIRMGSPHIFLAHWQFSFWVNCSSLKHISWLSR